MSGDDHVGMGMVIGPRTVLTCAHVVNEARGYDGTSTPRPTGQVRLVFPLAALQSERLAEVSKWIPVQLGTRSGDVALLQLAEDERDIDPDVGIATFADVTGRTIDEDRLGVYGIRGGETIGQHVQARFVGDAVSVRRTHLEHGGSGDNDAVQLTNGWTRWKPKRVASAGATAWS